jgi:hypothetical protein
MLVNDAANYPVVESNDQNIFIAADNDGFDAQLDESGSHGILDAYSADAGANQTVSQLLLDVLNNDPRKEIMLSPNKNGVYRGMKHDKNGSKQGQDRTDGLYAVIDSATFGWNKKFPGIFFTAAEVAFIKAEAFQKSYASGNAEQAFKQGVTLSVEFYFWLNSLSDYTTLATTPTTGEVSTFVDGLWSGESDKPKLIATQKWLHFSLFEQREAWAEVRRTGLPDLTFQDVTDAQAFHIPPSRFMYPENEYLYNRENYPADAKRDATEYQRKIFWAKSDGYFTTIPVVTN